MIFAHLDLVEKEYIRRPVHQGIGGVKTIYQQCSTLPHIVDGVVDNIFGTGGLDLRDELLRL